MCRLGSTAARLKLKGIDGGPHKQRSMWLNSTQREEPYQGLTYTGNVQRWAPPCGRCTGGAWLSSARVVRCWVKSRNERNPCSVLPACPLCLGLHTCYNGRYNELRYRKVERISKSRSQFGLGSATRPHEVGVASNRRSALLR